MPTLFRLLAVIGLVVAVVYGALYALATFVEPETRDLVEPVAPSRFVKRPGE